MWHPHLAGELGNVSPRWRSDAACRLDKQHDDAQLLDIQRVVVVALVRGYIALASLVFTRGSSLSESAASPTPTHPPKTTTSTTGAGQPF